MLIEISRSAGHGDGTLYAETPALFVGTVVFTIVTFYILMSASWYSYFCVMGVLSSIESPETNACPPVASFSSSDEKKPHTGTESLEPLLEPETVLVKKTTAITSSILRTMCHLRNNYGFLSRFRGFSISCAITLAHFLIAQGLCTPRFMRTVPGVLASVIIADIIASRWTLAWIHIVISEPTDQPWWKRTLPIKSWRKVVPAVAIFSIVKHAVVPLVLFVTFKLGVFDGLQNYKLSYSELAHTAVMTRTSAFILLLSMASTMTLQFMATIMLIRVAASLLPAESQTVVPFDRSFGGRIMPAAAGGQGYIGVVAAWTSFSWSGRFRVFKLVAKFWAIMATLVVLFIVAYGVELFTLGGDDLLSKLAKIASQVWNE